MVGRDVVFTTEKTPANPNEPVLTINDLVVKDYRMVLKK